MVCRCLTLFTLLLTLLASNLVLANTPVPSKTGQRIIFLPFHSEIKGRDFLKGGLAAMLASRVASNTRSIAVAGSYPTGPLATYLHLKQQKPLFQLLNKMHGNALILGDITPARTGAAILLSALVFTKDNPKNTQLFHQTVHGENDITQGIDTLAREIATTVFGAAGPTPISPVVPKTPEPAPQQQTATSPQKTDIHRYEIINPERAWREGLYNQ